MSDTFATLYKEVSDATKFLHTVEQCRPHYQRLLDYIQDHPDERDSIAALLAQHFDIYLLQFLTPSLKWPEIRAAAEQRWNDGGNHFYDSEIKQLFEIYGAV
jgi:hypothetical protein